MHGWILLQKIYSRYIQGIPEKRFICYFAGCFKRAYLLYLFKVCSERVSRGMLHVDRLPFVMLLARIYSKGVYESTFQLFLRFKEGVLPQEKV